MKGLERKAERDESQSAKIIPKDIVVIKPELKDNH